MRLDARNGDTNWNVFHVPTARLLKHVVWVDSEVKAWAEYAFPFLLEGDSPRINVHGAKCIDILAHERLVLIDPVEDIAPGETPAEVIAELTA